MSSTVSFRVETKRGTSYCSNPEVMSGELLSEARGLIEDILGDDNGFISIVETGGSEVFIPREEIAAVTIYKYEAEDE